MTSELEGLVPDVGYNPFAKINSWTESLMTQIYVIKDCKDKMSKIHEGIMEGTEEEELVRMRKALKEVAELVPDFLVVVSEERMRQAVNSYISYLDENEGNYYVDQ